MHTHTHTCPCPCKRFYQRHKTRDIHMLHIYVQHSYSVFSSSLVHTSYTTQYLYTQTEHTEHAEHDCVLCIRYFHTILCVWASTIHCVPVHRVWRSQHLEVNWPFLSVTYLCRYTTTTVPRTHTHSLTHDCDYMHAYKGTYYNASRYDKSICARNIYIMYETPC